MARHPLSLPRLGPGVHQALRREHHPDLDDARALVSDLRRTKRYAFLTSTRGSAIGARLRRHHFGLFRSFLLTLDPHPVHARPVLVLVRREEAALLLGPHHVRRRPLPLHRDRRGHPPADAGATSIIVLVTLGLGWPWAQVRSARFAARYLTLVGPLDLEKYPAGRPRRLRDGGGSGRPPRRGRPRPRLSPTRLAMRTDWDGHFLDGRTPVRRPARVRLTRARARDLSRGRAPPRSGHTRSSGRRRAGTPARRCGSSSGPDPAEAVVIADPAFLADLREIAQTPGLRFHDPRRRRRRVQLHRAAPPLPSSASAPPSISGAFPPPPSSSRRACPSRGRKSWAGAAVESLVKPEKQCREPEGQRALDRLVATLVAAAPRRLHVSHAGGGHQDGERLCRARRLRDRASRAPGRRHGARRSWRACSPTRSSTCCSATRPRRSSSTSPPGCSSRR